MTIDNLLAADVVTANGELVSASAEDHPDLFWGIRGGGGNFGVVTSFEFRLHPVGPQVLSGLIVHPFRAATSALQFYRDFTARASDDLSVWVVMRKAPPLPFLPEEVHGTGILAFAVLYSGDMEQGEKEVEELRRFGSPIADAVMPHEFTAFQAAFDPLLEPGARNYWRSHNFTAFTDDAIATVLEYAGDDDRCIAWARQFFDVTAPHATGGVYVNFMPDDEQDRVGAAYGENFERLLALKRKYDPDNLFRLNQNIDPGSL